MIISISNFFYYSFFPDFTKPLLTKLDHFQATSLYCWYYRHCISYIGWIFLHFKSLMVSSALVAASAAFPVPSYTLFHNSISYKFISQGSTIISASSLYDNHEMSPPRKKMSLPFFYECFDNFSIELHY